jgi:hypothetical protein
MAAAKLDAVTAAAVDLARDVALEAAGDFGVGDHLGVVADDERVVTHLFACPHRGYEGWQWAVTLVRASRAKAPTVNEVVLLPGPDALRVPAWVPWAERVEPGDLAPGMLMPTPLDDPRLDPGYTGGNESDDTVTAIRAVVHDLGLGRERVLSAFGRDSAAARWARGDGGAETPESRQAPAPCGTCGYFLRLRGSLGAGFGVCANGYASADGRVVTVDHGCGAHSDVVVDTSEGYLPDPVWDSIAVDEALFD